MAVDGAFDVATPLVPSPFRPAWGPHSVTAGGLGSRLLPMGCRGAWQCPPFDAIGESFGTRARVSLRLGLAPALVLGQLSPDVLSI